MKPLDGVIVVDFTRVLAGPTCTRVLAELGASVTKIEPPAGDMARAGWPVIDKHSGYYLQLNGGKRNLCIDLNWPEARQIVFKLCAKADVIAENYRPGTMKSFGLDYDTVAAINPRVVYVSMTGYGQDSPWSGRSAFAPTVQAESGATATHLAHYGKNLTEPVNDSSSHADLYTGLQGAIAALAGLNERTQTGKGTHADVSMIATMQSVNERIHFLKMEGREVYKAAVNAMTAAAQEVLERRLDAQLLGDLQPLLGIEGDLRPLLQLEPLEPCEAGERDGEAHFLVAVDDRADMRGVAHLLVLGELEHQAARREAPNLRGAERQLNAGLGRVDGIR